MNELILADPHWSENDRDQYRHNFVKQLRDRIRELKASAVYILGDLTEVKDRHPGWLANKVVDHIHSIAKIVPVFVMKGNHDFLGDASNPFFKFVGRIEGITWINTPVESKNIPGALKNSLFLPYTSNWKKDWAEFDFKNYEWIFAHQTFTGADVGHDHRLEGIPVDIFPKGVRVISGDIHVPQKIGPVTYVGSPYTIDFGDDFSPRMLLLQGKDMKSIPCTGPQKRLVEISSITELDRFTDIHKGDILKVRVHLLKQEKWPEIKKAVYEWGEGRYQIYSVLPVIDRKQTSGSIAKVQVKTDQEILESYAKMRNIDERVLKTGKFLLERGAV
jgi:calcineurin-like phosphoesterase family protein